MASSIKRNMMALGWVLADPRDPGYYVHSKSYKKSGSIDWTSRSADLEKAVAEASAMDKNALVAIVAANSGLSKAVAGKAVDGVLSVVTSALRRGDKVRLAGFGTFSVAQRAATEGRNPRTGAIIQIPASKQPKFKSSKALKQAVN